MLLDGASVGQRSTVRGSIVGPGAQIGDHCHIEDRVVLGEGVKVGIGQRAGGRGAYLPRGPAARGSDQVLTTSTSGDLTRDAVAAVDRAGQMQDILVVARPAAGRVVAGGIGQSPGARRARRPGRRRDGRIVDRRRAGPSGARRPRLAPDHAGARLRAAGLDDARHDRAVLELLGRDRGDAGDLRGGRGARGAPDRRHHRRQAGRRRARRVGPRDPAARWLSAARRGRLSRW